ncbi:hypothetical protein ACSBR2_027483 [Camellia fascicularis]
MASDIRCFYLILFAFLTAFASSSFISDDDFESRGSTGRTLLQAKGACSVNFEQQNYTIITSQCKGPNYQVTPCCNALKQFACPFADQINDEKSDCATTMFSYINIYGKYPPALFASLCREGKDGLNCSAAETEAAKNAIAKSGVPPKCTQSLMLMLTAGFLMPLFVLF